MTTLHELKCVGYGFYLVKKGEKKAEFRKADRDFTAGDVIWLREFVPEGERKSFFDEPFRSEKEWLAFLDTGYTGDYCWLRITHVQPGGMFGIPDGYVMLSVERVELVPS